MYIRLKNIGIVRDSSLKLDGLTVITGKNSSGKTTVGKALYSLLDGTYKLDRKAKIDKNYYIEQQLEKVADTLDFVRLARSFSRKNPMDIFELYPSLTILMGDKPYQKISKLDSKEFIYNLISDLTEFDVTTLEDKEWFKIYRTIYYPKSSKSDRNSLLDSIRQKCDAAINLLQYLLVDIDKDPELIDYARESINQTLKVEFSNQIQPIRIQSCTSRIELFDDSQAYFHIEIKNNNIVNDGIPVFLSSPYEKVYLVDDPFILDTSSTSNFLRISPIYEHDSFLDINRIVPHNIKLQAALKSKKSLSVFEQTVLSDSLKIAKEKIDQVLPGTFDFTQDGEYYVEEGTKLRFSNLATGSKMFSIIKVLLEKGELDQSTMLILDEPEAHLHPKWQNAFAEIIVLLVKELDVNILLTTHSPNFMLAIDAYMRKYDISEKTNFYQTDIHKDGFVDYHCVNDDMGQIYQDFLQYLSEVKMLRNQYLYNSEG